MYYAYVVIFHRPLIIRIMGWIIEGLVAVLQFSQMNFAR